MAKTPDWDHNCTGKDCRYTGCESAALSQALAAPPPKPCQTCGKKPAKRAEGRYCTPCYVKACRAQWDYAEGHHYASEGRR